MNSSFRLAPWADVLYACDAPWWSTYLHQVRQQFFGELWTQSTQARDQYGVHWMPSNKQPGLSDAPGVIADGGNSGHQAIGLAHQFGASRVVLLGYDFQRTYGKSHWHGDHPRPLGNLGDLPKWIARMNQLAVDARAQGMEIINCTRETALKCFPRAPLEDALQ